MDTSKIASIAPLWDSFPTAKVLGADAGVDSSFAGIFRSAIEQVRETDDEKNKLEYLLSTGQLDNPAELTIAATKAATAVDLLVQLRNKALEVHSELMRITL